MIISWCYNVENYSITTRNHAVTYYQPLEEALWQLGPKNSKMAKILKISIILHVFVLSTKTYNS